MVRLINVNQSMLFYKNGTRYFLFQVDSTFLSLFDGQIANEILLRALTLFQNINNCLREGCPAGQPPFDKGSLFSLLYGEDCAQKVRALVCHHDVAVKEKALAIMPKF